MRGSVVRRLVRPSAIVVSTTIALGLGPVDRAFGHDVWLEPPAPVEVDEPVRIEGRVGHGGTGRAFTRDPSRIVRLEAFPPAPPDAPTEAPRALPGADGSALLGAVRPDAAGTWVVVYESHPFRHTLPPDRFAAYLEEEGLDAVAAARAADGTTDTPGRELVSRAAKTLLPVVDDASQVSVLRDRRVGLPVELIAERIPRLDGEDDRGELVLRLEVGTFDGRPAGGRLVDLRRLDGPGSTRTARTDTDGRVRFTVGPGRWLAAAVVAREPAETEPTDASAEWRTIFASWTADLRPRSAGGGS